VNACGEILSNFRAPVLNLAATIWIGFLNWMHVLAQTDEQKNNWLKTMQ
jgi:hypothetical protein